MSDPIILILITAPDHESAARIADHLVTARLAACVNIIPGIRSLFSWEGAVQDEGEVLLVVKSRESLFQERLVPAVKSIHPYDVPEILALPVIGGYPPYMEWVKAETDAS